MTRLACARLREHGKNVARILAEAGLDAGTVDDPSARLEARAQVKVLELAAEELNDELLGFHLARDVDLRLAGLVYYVMASSEQLADALRNVERYGRIVNEAVRVRCRLDGGAAVWLDYLDIDRRHDRHHAEFWMVTLMRLCRQLTDNRLAPRRVQVRHLRPRPPAEFKAFFGTQVEFGADSDEILLTAPAASLPIVGRDTYLNDLLRRYADAALASRTPRRASTRSKVERILPELLPHGTASLSEVARRLGVSSRSLSRKLQEENTTFAHVLDELRATLAEHHLADHDLRVSEVAWLLGYQEVSSLTHAFKRWRGTTPRQFRLSGRKGSMRKSGTAGLRARATKAGRRRKA
jgi:AraC-like DNA-binding protein